MNQLAAAMQATAHEHLLLHFTRNGSFGPGRGELPILTRGEGPFLYDIHGRQYIDALSSLCCAQLGYSYGREMAAAATDEMDRLPFATVWAGAHPSAVQLAARLAELAPPGIEKVFFTSGGSESVESAWKIVRQYHVANGQPQRTKAIARKVAYHGVTLGALAFTGVPGFKDIFGPPAVPVSHVSNTNSYRSTETGRALTEGLLAEIEEVILSEGPETIAMIIAEPVQNAGGCFLPPDGYWSGIRELADRYGILVVADEVITAFGRLGEWFGSTRVGAEPDLITIAKGLTSSYAPMGAVLVHDRVAAPLYEDDRALLHGITFAGHPMCAAIALCNLEIFVRDRVLENVRELEAHFAAGLRELLALPIVGDVRGAGFFWAVEMVRDEDGKRFTDAECRQLIREYLPERLRAAGVIARPDDRGDPVIHLAPPLICDKATLDTLISRVGEVLADAGLHMDANRPPAVSTN